MNNAIGSKDRSSFIATLLEASGLEPLLAKFDAPIIGSVGSEIAGPGLLGFAGGVMNPSVLRDGQGGIIALAKANVRHWTKARLLRSGDYLKGSPVLFRLSSELNVDAATEIKATGKLGEQGRAIEDFRLFESEGRILVSHPLIKLERHFLSKTYTSAVQVISELDLDSGLLSYVSTPKLDIPLSSIEKNWLFFESNGLKRIIYSGNPLHVLTETGQGSFEFKTTQSSSIKSDPILSMKGISLSAGVVDYDEKYFMLVFHKYWSVSGARVYVHWGMLFDKVSFLPRYRTKNPLVVGGGARGDMPGISYVMGVLARGEDLVFSIGESDAYSSVVTVSRADIDGNWISVH